MTSEPGGIFVKTARSNSAWTGGTAVAEEPPSQARSARRMMMARGLISNLGVVVGTLFRAHFATADPLLAIPYSRVGR